MALGDKETTLILKAVDQSSQPVLQVLANVKKLVEQQKELNAASKQGAADRSDFNKSIADLEKLLRALGQQKATLEEVNRLRDTWLDKQIAIDELAQRAENIQYVPEESRTKDQIKDLGRLEKQMASMQPKVDAARAAWENMQKVVAAMGVTSKNFTETQLLLASAMDEVASHYKQANQLSLEFIANKKAAAAATKAQADEEKKAANEQLAAARAEEAADAEFAARRRAERVEEARALAEANKSMAAANAAKSTHSSREEDIKAAFANAEAEKKAREEAAKVQDRDDREFVTRNRAMREEEAKRIASAEADIKRFADVQRRLRQESIEEAFAAAAKEAEARKLGLEAEDRYNKEFAARRREEREAEAKRVADANKSMAAANAAKSTRGSREEDIKAAFAEAEAEKKAREEASVAEDKANAEFIARNREARQAEAERVAAAEADIKRLADAQVRARREEIAGAFEARDAEVAAQNAAKKAAEDRYKAEQKQRAADLDAMQALYDFEQMLQRRQKEAFDARVAQQAQLAQQQDLAAKARLSLPVTQALGVSAAGPGNFSSTADDLAKIVSPAEAARKTLHGVEAEVESLGGLMEGGRKRTEDYRQALRTLNLSLNELGKQASLIDAFKRQDETARIAEAGLKRHTDALTRLQQQGRASGTVIDGFDEKVKKTEQAARKAAEAFNVENERLAQLRAGLERAGISYLNIDAAITRVTAAAEHASKLLPALEKGAGKGSEIGLFGLRPYELQNLSYQVNDVFTQLSSGTSITQTFSQQFGQIFQLFQVQLLNFTKSLREIPGLLPGIGIGIAALTVYILAMVRAMDEVTVRRGFAAQLALGVDTAAQSAQTLMDAAKNAERLGIDLKEAAKGAAELSRSAVPSEKIGGLVEMAAKLSKATLRPFADTMKEVQTAFTGGYEEMRKFLVEYNMLDANTDERIRKLYRENDAEKARGIASEVASRQAQKGYEEFSGPAEKATLKLHNAWRDFLASFGDEKNVASWTSFWAGALNVVTIVDAFFTKRRFGGGNDPITTAPQSGATQSEGGPEFAALRDRIADLVGINKEAFARLQKSEGQLGPDGKWLDAHDAEGNVIPDGGKGAIQLVRSTFDELKHKYPELIKGDIHDITSNLMAGALYFREMMEKTGGNVERAALAYKAGPGALANPGIARPGYAEAARKVGEGMGSGLVTSSMNADAAKRSIEGLTVAVTDTGKATEAAKIATDKWTDAEDKRTRAMSQNGVTEAQRRKNLADQIRDSDNEVIESAAKAAKEGRTEALSRTEIERVQLERRKILRQNYAVAEIARELEVTSQFEELKKKELEADKTNLDGRLTANRATYDKLRQQVERFNIERRYPTTDGLTYETAKKAVEDAEANSKVRVILDTANEIVKRAQEDRDKAFKMISDRLAQAKPTEIAALNAEQAKVVAEGTRKVTEAVARADAALAKIPDSPEVQAQRQRNALAAQTAGGGQTARSLTDQAIGLATQSVTDVAKERTDNIDALISSVKSGSVKFSDALRTGTELIRTMAPRLDTAVNDANKALLATLPGATPGQQAKINANIAANNLLRTKANEDLERLITEGLKDDQDKVTALVRQRNEADAGVYKRQHDGIIDYLKMTQEIAANAAKFNPQIKAATDKVVANTREALTVPGLRPGFAEQLRQQGEHAGEQGDTNLAGAESKRQEIAAGLAQLDTLRGYLRDTEREQAALQKTNDATIISSEPKRAEAYKKTAEEAAKIIPILRKQIDEAEALGQITPASAAKSRAALAEFGAETKYVSKFQEELSQTIQSSIGQHAMQAIDTVAQALGNLAVGTGTLKDVFKSVGMAFAEFTAGVLKDIATMIIKFYVLAAVKNMLNIESGGLTGLFGAVGSAGTAAVKHSGGIVGDGNGASRVVDLSLFRNARRMHAGGIAGLSADEVPTILQKGERVQTEAQQRMAAAGGGGSGGTAVRNVLAVGDKEIAGAMNGAHGEKVILNVLQRNAPTVKKWVG